MADYLMRDDASLSSEEWEQVDKIVVEVAKRRLVGRRVLPIFGPLGAGIETVAVDSYEGFGLDNDSPIQQKERSYTVLQNLSKDFVLKWQDIEAAHKRLTPLSLGAAAAAAANVVMAEDTLIFRGDKKSGQDGLMTVKGAANVKMSDWSVGNAFSDVTKAIQKLQENGFPGPFALVVSPADYAYMQKPYADTGAMEINLVRELVEEGVFQSPVLKQGEGVLIADGPQNADIAIGIDLTVAALGPDDMDQRFRVFETLALRIKRPDAICTLTK